MLGLGIGLQYNRGLISGAVASTDFIMEVTTTTPSETFTIPTTGVGYDYNVITSEQTFNNQTGDVLLTFASAGTHNINISGDFPRIFFDNIKHIKAYWPMIGKETTQSLLSFGVDDIDGTIDDSTKIYSMAGVEDQNPTMSTNEITSLIKNVKRKPIERDSIYNQLKVYE